MAEIIKLCCTFCGNKMGNISCDFNPLCNWSECEDCERKRNWAAILRRNGI